MQSQPQSQSPKGAGQAAACAGEKSESERENATETLPKQVVSIKRLQHNVWQLHWTTRKHLPNTTRNYLYNVARITVNFIIIL